MTVSTWFINTLFLSLCLPTVLGAGTYTTFPAGSCRPQSCHTHNPYELVPVGEFYEKAEHSKSICFRVEYKGCDGPCCETLTRVLEKIAIKVNPQCGRASYTGVTIDGVKKGGGVYFEDNLGFSELRVTSLRWNASTGVGKTICIDGLRAPCPNALTFCSDDRSDTENEFGGCVYSVYDPFSHRCCPTCPFEGFATNGDVIPMIPIITPLQPTPPPHPSLPSPPSSPPAAALKPPPSHVSQPPPLPPHILSPSPLLPPPPHPTIPSPGVASLRLTVKVPLPNTDVDDTQIINILCDELEQAVLKTLDKDDLGLLCKPLLKSTTGVYYGMRIIVRPENDIKKMTRLLTDALQHGRMAGFTSLARLKCGSTVVLTTYDDRSLRYRASLETCV